MLDIRLAYDIANAMELNGEEFSEFLADCNDGNALEWQDRVFDFASDEDYEEFLNETGLPKRRVFQISLDVDAPANVIIADLINEMRTSIKNMDASIVGWNQDTSWSTKEYYK